MPRHQESKILPFAAERMYGLVADVGRYPEFLPWCLAADVREESRDHVLAELTIGWKILRESFLSHVHLSPGKIEVEYKDGPFRYLHNSWQFAPQGKNKCKIDFMVDFEFRSPMLAAVMQPLFGEAVRRMIAAFEARAEELYA